MPSDPRNSLANPLWALSGLGFELFGAIAGMGFLGWAVDRYIIGSGSTALMVGLLIGILGGGSNFIRKALALNRRAVADYRRAAGRKPSIASATPHPPSVLPDKAYPSSPPGHGWFETESPSSEEEPERDP